jgi:TonB-dependent receptor
MKKSVLMMSTALAVGLTPLFGAMAEDTSTLETIVVSGFRGSLHAAIDLKHQNVGNSDTIVADDIAAFPDLNLAESMQRIPGVAITRDSGEGRQITLRGLGPDFTRTQLNGMETLANTASGMDNRGLVSRTRAFDFSMFASELFNRVTVQKSWEANQDEGGIAGTVQLTTAKPFDYDGFKAVLTAKGIHNTNVSGVTPRVVGLISDRWGAFGALLSVAYSTNDSNEYGYRNWNWGQITLGAANVGANIPADVSARLQGKNGAANNVWSPQAQTYSTWFDHRERLGITSALQYHPTEALSVDVDLLYGRLTNHRNDYALASAGSPGGLTGNVSGPQVLNSVTLDSFGTMVAANYSHIDLRSENNEMRDTTKYYQGVTNVTWTPIDALTVHGMFGASRSEYALPEFDKVFMESKNHNVSWDYTGKTPVNTYDGGLTDVTKWQLMRMDTQESAITSEYVTAKFDADYKLNNENAIEAGFEYKRFLNSGWTRTNKVNRNAGNVDTVIPDNLKIVEPYKTTGKYVVGDMDPVYAYIGQIRDLTPTYDVPGSNFNVTENTLNGYLQYDLNTTLFGMGLRANAGVRYFSSDLVSSGVVTQTITNPDKSTQTVQLHIAVPHHYNSFLPSANIALDLSDQFVTRFSISRNLSRPALGDLATAATLSTAPFGGSISVGNPGLKPWMADSIDWSIDYYEGKTGYASFGMFYKNMENMITSATKTVPYNTLGFPISWLFDPTKPDVPYNYSTPINGRGAHIAGFEAAVQKDFDFLPAPFDGFGFTGNVTYADGNNPITYSGTAINMAMMNLSKFSANATLYYETQEWGARLSTAYRSKYLVGAGGNGNLGEGMKPTNNVDFAAHYNVNDQLKLVVEGINLTNQPITQYADKYADRLEVRTKSGVTFTFGATYEF